VAPDHWYSFTFEPGTVAVDEPMIGSGALATLSASPFRAGTRLTLAADLGATVRIHGADGREVRTLSVARGVSSIEWDGRDTDGRPVPPGVYFLDVRQGERRQVLRAVRVP
jgi:hypothetical protein